MNFALPVSVGMLLDNLTNVFLAAFLVFAELLPDAFAEKSTKPPRQLLFLQGLPCRS